MGYKKSYDLYKLRMIKKRKYKSGNWEELKNLICGLSSDSAKIEILNDESYFKDIYSNLKIEIKREVIESLQSDDSKISMINSLDELFDKREIEKLISNKIHIILSFASDKKKIEQFIELYNMYGDKVLEYTTNIIYSLSSDDFKKQLLDALGYSSNSLSFIENSNSDEIKEKYIRAQDYLPFSVIMKLKSDALKQEFLPKFCHGDYSDLLASLSEECDDYKRERFNELDHLGKLKVAKSYGLDEYKEEYIKELENERREEYFRLHWRDETEEEMNEYLSKYPYDAYDEEKVAQIVATFKSNELKLKYLSKMSQSKNQMLIISSLGYVKTEREPEDVLISVEQLGDSARKLFAQIVSTHYNNFLDNQEEEGVKTWEKMEESRRELLKLVERNKATIEKMIKNIRFFEGIQLQDSEGDRPKE